MSNYIVGNWVKVGDGGGCFECPEPRPARPNEERVFSEPLFIDGMCLPVDQAFCIAELSLENEGRTWRIVDSLPRILDALIAALKDAAWEKDVQGQLCVIGGTLRTEYGLFQACYYQERKKDEKRREPASIHFLPQAGVKYREALDCVSELLVCNDKEEIRRALEALSPPQVKNE